MKKGLCVIALAALLLAAAVPAHAGAEGTEAALPAWSLVLHGDEDLTVALPEGFWTDLGLFAAALDQTNGLSFLTREEGMPCEITQVK